MREGVQKHVAVADDYYLFTRETAGERLLVVFYKGAVPKSLSVDLTGTSIVDAQGVKPLLAGTTATLENKQLTLQVTPLTVSMYRVD